MKTLTKSTFIDEHLSKFERRDLPCHPRDFANQLIELISAAIVRRQIVHIMNLGRIRTLLKAPRKGSNLGNAEAKGSIIPARYDVRIITSATPQVKGTDNRYILADLASDIAKLGVSQRVASKIAKEFYTFIYRCLERDTRIEIRGLGVFSSKTTKAGTVRRNPAINQAITLKQDKVTPRFRPSRLLLQRITDAHPIDESQFNDRYDPSY